MKSLESPEQLQSLRSLPVSLVYGGDGRSALPGTRGLFLSRRFLYKVEDLFLDLQVERASRSASTILAGQLADSRCPEEFRPGIPVALVAAGKFVARVVSNQLGEFCVAFSPRSPTTLCLAVEGRGRIEIPIAT